MPARRVLRKATVAAALSASFIVIRGEIESDHETLKLEQNLQSVVDAMGGISANNPKGDNIRSDVGSMSVPRARQRAMTAIYDEANAALGSHADVYLPSMSEIDEDKDHKVSKPELNNWILRRNEETFARVDKDGDGFLTAEEYNNWGLLEHVPREFQEKVKNVATETTRFWTAFWNSLGMILATEIGDKTFFIAAVLAMRHAQGVVFTGAISALIVMTVLSVTIGFALPNILPREYTHHCATLLFLYFGIRLLYDAQQMIKKGEGKGPSEELEEVEIELAGKHLVERKDDDDAESRGSGGGGAECEPGTHDVTTTSQPINKKLLHILSQAFILTFMAEWGDRSQIATIALASDKDPLGVTLGGVVGHSMCTGLACIGGRMLAAKINERTVLIFGGSLFIVFGLLSFFGGPD